MGSLIDFNDDGNVSPEEEALALFLLMDEDVNEESDFSSHGSGCLMTVLSFIGLLTMVLVLQ